MLYKVDLGTPVGQETMFISDFAILSNILNGFCEKNYSMLLGEGRFGYRKIKLDE